MIKLYLFERNVFTAIFFTPLSQQVIRNHISETEKKHKNEIFHESLYTSGWGNWTFRGKKFGIQGTSTLYPTSPTNATRISGTGVYCNDLRFWTDRCKKQCQFLKEQSDQGPHCLPFHLHLLDELLTTMFKFLGVLLFSDFNNVLSKDFILVEDTMTKSNCMD